MRKEERYAERPSAVPGAVLWSNGISGGGEKRVLPDGCMDLIWSEGRLMVAGPDSSAYVLAARPGRRYVGIRFAPGTAPALLGVPAYQVRDARVELADIWSAAEARRLEKRFGDDPLAALETVATELAEEVGAPARSTGLIVAGVRQGLAVPDIADEVGLSERQFRRRCLDLFGYGPKTLGRILRMNRALELGRAGQPLAAVAATTGYADQAHFTREVRSLTGVPPLGLLAS